MECENLMRDETQAAMKKTVRLKCQAAEMLNYAKVNNGTPVIREITLENLTDSKLSGLALQIASPSLLSEPFSQNLMPLQPGITKLQIPENALAVNTGFLVSLTERCTCQIAATLTRNGEILDQDFENITAEAFDMWPYDPPLLASFVMPNHPVVTSLIQQASAYLGRETDSPSLNGYQSHDPNRVNLMAASAYAAMQKMNITYAEPPASFGGGQRIRLPDAVLAQHLGTCMDMTLLYAACLEAMGLHPILVLMEGHIFAGVWLKETSFPELLVQNPTQLEMYMTYGKNDLTVVECTAMCAGKSRSYEAATEIAKNTLRSRTGFRCAIDLTCARTSRIYPLPVRVQTANGFKVLHEERKDSELTAPPDRIEDGPGLSEFMKKEELGKQALWERKLLDLSTKNALLNTRLTGAVVPLFSPSLRELEDALADGEEFRILPRPAKIRLPDHITMETLTGGASRANMEEEGKQRRLYSLLTENELDTCLTRLYRSAKASLEENGASTLYLTLGMLQWFEAESGSAPRYAPIVLVPIEIIRKSASQGYALCMRDEDAQVNVTLLEFLKQEKDVHLSGMDPPPGDAHGLDIPKIFDIFRQAVVALPGWDVLEVSVIGSFSFTQFMMWNDIHGGEAFLSHNKLVRSLLLGRVGWDTSIPDRVRTDEAFVPVSLDDSQLQAVNMAAADVSFVLHGPPGTGKSQTITAMIANALAKGKTVLFVAEKMAALEVVQKRLSALGIGDFCLELHSNKSTRKSVLDQLGRVLESTASGQETHYEQKIEDIRRMRKDLNAYAQALHAVRPCGKSLRQLIDRYESLRDPGECVRFDPRWIRTLTGSDLDHQCRSLERLVAAGRAIGHPCNHPLRAVGQTEYSQRMKFELDSLAGEWHAALRLLEDEAASFAALTETQSPVSASDWQAMLDFARSLASAEEIPDFLREAADPAEAFTPAERVMAGREALAARKSALLVHWRGEFLQADLTRFRAGYEQANQKFLGKKKALDALTAELQTFARFTVRTERIPAYLADVESYQAAAAELASAEATLPEGWQAILDACPSAGALQAYKNDVLQRLREQDRDAARMRALAQAGALQAARQKAGSLCEAWDAAQTSECAVSARLTLRFEAEADWLSPRRALCEDILAHAESVRDWITYRRQEAHCRELGLGPVCEAYAAGLEHEALVPLYQRSVTRMLILSIMEDEPALNRFTGTGFQALIAQFKKLDADCMELTRQEMVLQLQRRLPQASESAEISSELYLLRRAIHSGGRGLSVRSLFAQIPHLLSRLCPCMLMSPLSVSQYLQPENDLFDVIVFDEASQLPTCKAVGVLARGRNAVIVGDPNQMPPTSFFAGSALEEDETSAIDDLDSILDDCLALGMPQTELKWHYRSRHESLIAYSNREFYGGSMYTFPSVNDRARRVKFTLVNGRFERGKARVNRAEAEAVVAEIQRRRQSPSQAGQSIGVITFNVKQQTLIEDLLQEAYRKDPDFDRWATGGEDPLFVKNLENVQGDERDVILFSIAYGRDPGGKLSMNFGPLNGDGGWKRLNVAITRARCEMVVFSSITSSMINLKRASSRGVEALKGFLAYAETGVLRDNGPADAQADPAQGILQSICRALTESGWQYQTAVGRSAFRVDLAVVNPYDPETYLLGILLDGESYRQSKNARDREISQKSILEGLGWTLHRIWAMDWWDDRERELSRLAELLETCRAEAEARSRSAQSDAGGPGPAAESVPPAEPCPAHHAQERPAPEQPVPEQPMPEQPADSNGAAAGPSPSAAPASADTVTPEPVRTGAAEAPGRSPAALHYHVEPYRQAHPAPLHMTAGDYLKPENLPQIVQRMQEILDVESPLLGEQLVSKTLLSLGLRTSGPQMDKVSEKALRRAGKRNQQQGVPFYWRKHEDPAQYDTFRTDPSPDSRRAPDEIPQQELKNAVCVTLLENGPLKKEDLIRKTVRTMGYARTGPALKAAVERGIAYGKRTGEILLTEEALLMLPGESGD